MVDWSLFDPLFDYARKRSLWIVSFCTGCGGVEMPPLMTSRFDLERFGMLQTPSPRQYDLFLITGYVSPKTLKRIIITYEMADDPKYVLAHGSCPINGGVYWDSYNVIKQLDNYIPVDVAIAGCMPRPEAVMDGIDRIMEKIESDEDQAWKDYKENYEEYKENQEKLFKDNWKEKEAERWLPWLEMK